MTSIVLLLKQNIILRIAAYVTLISIIIVIFVAATASENVEAIRYKTAILNNRQSILLNFEKILDLYSRQFDHYRSKLDYLRPSSDKVVNILESMESKALKRNIHINIQSVPLDNISSNLMFVRYKLTFDGNRKKLNDFIEVLDDLYIYYEIQDVSIIKIKDSSLYDFAMYQLTIDIFVK